MAKMYLRKDVKLLRRCEQLESENALLKQLLQIQGRYPNFLTFLQAYTKINASKILDKDVLLDKMMRIYINQTPEEM